MTAASRGSGGTGRTIARTLGWAVAGALALSPAAYAAAQETPTDDAIGDILEAPAAPASAPVPQTAEPAPATAAPPPPASAPDAKPVYVDEVGRTPDGPPTLADRTYEARLRASFASAQGLQGPLDGRWTLSVADEDLYALQLVDKGGSNLEGAWRDVHRAGAVQGSGFLAEIARVGSSLTFRFQPNADGPALNASLAATQDGRWTGELTDGASRRTVVMRRD